MDNKENIDAIGITILNYISAHKKTNEIAKKINDGEMLVIVMNGKSGYHYFAEKISSLYNNLASEAERSELTDTIKKAKASKKDIPVLYRDTDYHYCLFFFSKEELQLQPIPLRLRDELKKSIIEDDIARGLCGSMSMHDILVIDWIGASVVYKIEKISTIMDAITNQEEREKFKAGLGEARLWGHNITVMYTGDDESTEGTNFIFFYGRSEILEQTSDM